MTLRVTAVCSGNICRSPIAEVVLRAAVERAGLADAVVVDSAGIGGWHIGGRADRRAIAVLRAHGYDGSAHRAQQITRDWFVGDSAPDLLLAMDTTHERDLRRLAPGTEIRLMRSYDPAVAGHPEGHDDDGLDDHDLDVPDPYYGELSGFEEVLAMIEAATPGTLDRIRALLTH